MIVEKKIIVDIDHCWNACPYNGLDFNVMTCDHPQAPNNGYIISHPECDTGFPEDCPLIID
jgi:hypothetical protein